MLSTAKISSGGTASSGSTTTVTYCFGTKVSKAKAHDFMIVAYLPTVTETAKSAKTSTDCVTATFGSVTAADHYVLAVAKAGAVTTTGGHTSVQSSASLSTVSGAPQGGTTAAPSLVSASPDATSHQITYVFSSSAPLGTTGSTTGTGTATGGGATGSSGATTSKATTSKATTSNATTSNGAGSSASASAGGVGASAGAVVSPTGPSAHVGTSTGATTSSGTHATGSAHHATGTSPSGSSAKSTQQAIKKLKLTPSKFGYYLATGSAVTGKKIAAVQGDSVVVTFTGAKADSGSTSTSSGSATVGNAAREVVAPGALTDVLGQQNVPGSVGKSTADPVLSKASRVTSGLGQVDFTFDQNLTTQPDPTRFVAYTAAGRPILADAATLTSPTTVRATFTGLAGAGNEIVRVAVLTGAVHGAGLSTATSNAPSATGTPTTGAAPSGTTTMGSTKGTNGSASATSGTGSAGVSGGTGKAGGPNVVGSVALTGGRVPSPTAGPNLTSASAASGDSIVTYTFDQPLRQPSCLPQAQPVDKLQGSVTSGSSTGGSNAKSGSGSSTASKGSSTGGTKSTGNGNGGGCDAAGFEVVTGSGSVMKGETVVAYGHSGTTATATTVAVMFQKPITGTAKAYSVSQGAVQGLTGLKNTIESVGAGSATAGGTTSAAGGGPSSGAGGATSGAPAG